MPSALYCEGGGGGNGFSRNDQEFSGWGGMGSRGRRRFLEIDALLRLLKHLTLFLCIALGPTNSSAPPACLSVPLAGEKKKGQTHTHHIAAEKNTRAFRTQARESDQPPTKAHSKRRPRYSRSSLLTRCPVPPPTIHASTSPVNPSVEPPVPSPRGARRLPEEHVEDVLGRDVGAVVVLGCSSERPPCTATAHPLQGFVCMRVRVRVLRLQRFARFSVQTYSIYFLVHNVFCIGGEEKHMRS